MALHLDDGGLTAGRGTPDRALFPYYTDDRIHDAGETTGSETLLRVSRGSETHLWEPFTSRQEGMYRTVRNLDKSVYGNAIRFEEVNQDLGITFRYTWMTSERYGFVRSAEVENTGSTAAAVQVKEDLISRFSDMGVVVADGRIRFVPERANGEFLETPGAFEYVAADGTEARLDLEAGTMGYTLCQVPVVLHRSGEPRVEVTRVDPKPVGTTGLVATGLVPGEAASAAVFDRSGEIARLDVFLDAVD